LPNASFLPSLGLQCPKNDSLFFVLDLEGDCGRESGGATKRDFGGDMGGDVGSEAGGEKGGELARDVGGDRDGDRGGESAQMSFDI